MAEQIKFYFDEHVPRAVARALERRGVDVLTAQAGGRQGISDRDQIWFALQQGRVIVSMDSDYLVLAAAGVPRGNSLRNARTIHRRLDPGFDVDL